METTIVFRVYRDSTIVGLYRDYIRVILALYRDNGKENGNYRDYRGYIGIIGYIIGVI